MKSYTETKGKRFTELIADIIAHGEIVAMRYEVSSHMATPEITIEFLDVHFWRIKYVTDCHGTWYIQDIFQTAAYPEPSVNHDTLERTLKIIEHIEGGK